MKREFGSITDLLPKLSLNIDKIFKLKPDEQKLIMSMFQDMMVETNNIISTNMYAGITNMIVLFNTLYDNGYLITIREINLNKLEINQYENSKLDLQLY